MKKNIEYRVMKRTSSTGEVRFYSQKRFKKRFFGFTDWASFHRNIFTTPEAALEVIEKAKIGPVTYTHEVVIENV